MRRTAAAAVLALGAAALSSSAAGPATAGQGPGLAPASGRFLVAQRDLTDPNFRETVVLLTEVDETGAMGLIVNWPTAAPLARLMPQVEGLEGRDDTVFVGGPVSRQLILMLARSAEELPGARRIFADVHLSNSLELLRRVVSGAVETSDVRLYSGYAGWGPGQLEFELEAGGWRVLPGDAELVFAADPDSVWPELVRRGEAQWTRRRPAAAARPAP